MFQLIGALFYSIFVFPLLSTIFYPTACPLLSNGLALYKNDGGFEPPQNPPTSLASCSFDSLVDRFPRHYPIPILLSSIVAISLLQRRYIPPLEICTLPLIGISETMLSVRGWLLSINTRFPATAPTPRGSRL